MNGLPPEVIKALQIEYKASFSQKAFDLDSAIEKHDLEKLQDAFHKLAGSGKTYGMPEISTLARCAENYLKESAEKDFKILTEMVHLMKKVFETRIQDGALNVDNHPLIQSLAKFAA